MAPHVLIFSTALSVSRSCLGLLRPSICFVRLFRPCHAPLGRIADSSSLLREKQTRELLEMATTSIVGRDERPCRTNTSSKAAFSGELDQGVPRRRRRRLRKDCKEAWFWPRDRSFCDSAHIRRRKAERQNRGLRLAFPELPVLGIFASMHFLHPHPSVLEDLQIPCQAFLPRASRARWGGKSQRFPLLGLYFPPHCCSPKQVCPGRVLGTEPCHDWGVGTCWKATSRTASSPSIGRRARKPAAEPRNRAI